MGVKRAGNAGDRGAEAECQKLDAHHVDAHHFRGGLVLVDRIHGAAEARALEPGEKQKQDDDDSDDVFQRVGIERRFAEALRAADVFPAQRDHRNDLGKS